MSKTEIAAAHTTHLFLRLLYYKRPLGAPTKRIDQPINERRIRVIHVGRSGAHLQEVADVLDEPAPLVGKVDRVIGVRDYRPDFIETAPEVREKLRLGQHGRVRVLISGDLVVKEIFRKSHRAAGDPGRG